MGFEWTCPRSGRLILQPSNQEMVGRVVIVAFLRRTPRRLGFPSPAFCGEPGKRMRKRYRRQRFRHVCPRDACSPSSAGLSRGATLPAGWRRGRSRACSVQGTGPKGDERPSIPDTSSSASYDYLIFDLAAPHAGQPCRRIVAPATAPYSPDTSFVSIAR